MLRKRTNSMVEGAIFAAIAIVFNLVFAYIPLAGVFLQLVMPLPIVICGMRNGLRWSILSTVVATVIVAMVVNPIHALFFIAVFGIMGIVLGECMHRHLAPGKLLLYSSLGAVVSIALNMVLALYVMGINPVTMMFTSLDDAVPQIGATLASSGMDPETAAGFMHQMKENVSMMKLILPGAMLLVAPLLVLVNYWAGRKVLSRMGERFEGFPPADRWGFPVWVAGAYIVGLFAIQFFNTDKESWQFILAANVWAISSMLLVVQGLVLLYWYLKKNGKPGWVFKVAFAACMLIPLFALIMTYVGGYDILFDVRELRGKKKKRK